jgi:hypothetical protein
MAAEVGHGRRWCHWRRVHRHLTGSDRSREPRVHINDQHTDFQFGKLWISKWKQLIFVVNFFYGLRVNEILNKTFILV